MWFYIFTGRQFEEHIWERIPEKNQTNVNNVTMHALIQALSWDIEKRTVEKGQTNATSVTMPLHEQTIWRDIWKHTMEKSQTNATNVTNMTMPFLWLVWVGEWQDFLQSTYTCMYRRTNSIKVFTPPPNLLRDAKTLLYIIKRLYKLKCYAKVEDCMRSFGIGYL